MGVLERFRETVGEVTDAFMNSGTLLEGFDEVYAILFPKRVSIGGERLKLLYRNEEYYIEIEDRRLGFYENFSAGDMRTELEKMIQKSQERGIPLIGDIMRSTVIVRPTTTVDDALAFYRKGLKATAAFEEFFRPKGMANTAKSEVKLALK